MKLIPKRKRIVPKGSSTSLQDVINDMSVGIANVTITTEKTVSSEAGIEFVIDEGGSVLSAGVKGYLSVPFNCTITAAELLASPSGSIIVDIWSDILGSFPPTDADSITGGSPPTIAVGSTFFVAAPATWIRELKKYRNLAFNVDSCSTITRCTVTLYVKRT